jgi:hypothetical protein
MDALREEDIGQLELRKEEELEIKMELLLLLLLLLLSSPGLRLLTSTRKGRKKEREKKEKIIVYLTEERDVKQGIEGEELVISNMKHIVNLLLAQK